MFFKGQKVIDRGGTVYEVLDISDDLDSLKKYDSSLNTDKWERLNEEGTIGVAVVEPISGATFVFKEDELKPMNKEGKIINLYSKKRANNKLLDQKARIYKISEATDDYLYLEVRALTIGIPNANGDLFVMPEVTKIHEASGQPVYKTFVGKGVYVNHNSDDPRNSIGLIFDSELIDDPDDPHIRLLIGVDKKKAPEIVDGLLKGRINSVSMGCFPAGTPIKTKDGEALIENIKVGDIIISHTGELRKVTAIQVRDFNPAKEKFFKVKLPGILDSVYVTGEHPFLGITKEKVKKLGRENIVENDLEFIPVEELKPWDFVAQYIDTTIKEDENATKEFARLLGLYLADGCLEKQKGKINGFHFSFGKYEKNIIEETKQLIQKLAPDALIHEKYNEKYNVVNIDVNNARKLATLVKEYAGEYSRFKKLKDIVLFWKPELQLELIGAFIEGDGHQSNGKQFRGNVFLSTGSKILAKQFLKMFLRNKILPRIQVIKAKGKDTLRPHDHYQIHIGKRDVNKIAAVCKSVDQIEIKAKSDRRFFINDNYLLIPITKLQRINYKGKVYNFSVEKDESYIANDIAVHNCSIRYSTCTYCGKKIVMDNDLCDCLKYHRGEKIGNVIVAEELHDIEFYEISIVSVPADYRAQLINVVAGSNRRLKAASVDNFTLVNLVIEKIFSGTYEEKKKLLENL